MKNHKTFITIQDSDTGKDIRIDIDNIDKAIEEAQFFKGFKAPETESEEHKSFAKKRQEYWEDRYNQLVVAKNNIPSYK
ncbi:MAG: hypothetical protein MUE72_13750 [Chitinophagaceae bacterium]|jgi:actin-related protein|nr:hypothetical protein [Chitinophagaceae bacterium]